MRMKPGYHRILGRPPGRKTSASGVSDPDQPKKERMSFAELRKKPWFALPATIIAIVSGGAAIIGEWWAVSKLFFLIGGGVPSHMSAFGAFVLGGLAGNFAILLGLFVLGGIFFGLGEPLYKTIAGIESTND